MDLEFTKWLSGLGVGGVLAAVMFTLYRKDAREAAALWKGQTEILVQVVKDNTAAFVQNTTVILSLKAHIMRQNNNGDRPQP